jgi:hypothetical protein
MAQLNQAQLAALDLLISQMTADKIETAQIDADYTDAIANVFDAYANAVAHAADVYANAVAGAVEQRRKRRSTSSAWSYSPPSEPRHSGRILRAGTPLRSRS